MIKVIIIDDEPLVTRNVKYLVENADPEFTVIGMAHDGRTALGIIEELKPDLLFVDLFMPVMDGFELLEELKKNRNEIPSVILSGYGQFELAKKAIKLGVLDYLVKPINPMAMEPFLNSLKETLQEKRHERIRQMLQEALLYGNLSETSYTYTEEASLFYICKVCYGAYRFFRNNQFEITSSRNKCQELEREMKSDDHADSCWVLESKENNEFWLIVQAKETEENQIFKGIYDKENAKGNVTFVTHGSGITLSELYNMKNELEALLYQFGEFGCSRILLLEEIEAYGTELYTPDTSAVLLWIKQKRIRELKQSIRELMLDMKEHHVVQRQMVETLYSIMQTQLGNGSLHEVYFMLNLMISEAVDYNMLADKLAEELIAYLEIGEDKPGQEKENESIILAVRDYLDQNYGKRIKMQEVADRFGFNNSYLCHLFHRRFGVSPNEYVIEKRIEFARQLLCSHDLPVKEIAELVGYTDPFYFSRMFKSIVGMNPTEYRRGKYERKTT